MSPLPAMFSPAPYGGTLPKGGNDKAVATEGSVLTAIDRAALRSPIRVKLQWSFSKSVVLVS